jgi:hypothetical protein
MIADIVLALLIFYFVLPLALIVVLWAFAVLLETLVTVLGTIGEGYQITAQALRRVRAIVLRH